MQHSNFKLILPCFIYIDLFVSRVNLPLRLAITYTIPDVTIAANRHLYPLTALLAIVWLGRDDILFSTSYLSVSLLSHTYYFALYLSYLHMHVISLSLSVALSLALSLGILAEIMLESVNTLGDLVGVSPVLMGMTGKAS